MSDGALATEAPPGSPSGRPTLRNRRSPLELVQDYGIYVFLAAILVFDLVATTGFTEWASYRSLFIETAPLALVAIGQAFCIGTRGIDLSVGSNMALASAVLPLAFGFSVTNATETRSAAVAIVAALGIPLAAGTVTGLLVSVLDINPLIVTLGMQLAVRGLAESLTSGNQIPMSDGTLNRLSQGRVLDIPVMAIIVIVVTLAAWATLRSTVFGRRVIAIGGNPRAGFISGLPVKRILVVVYALSGLLAGAAGILLSAYLGSGDPGDVGLNYELLAIAAVVLGGTPLSGGRITVVGSIAGALVLQDLSNTFVGHNLSSSTATLVEAILIVIAVYFQRRRGN